MCTLAAQENGHKRLKPNKKKLIYLISPNKIYKNFFIDLKLILKTQKVFFFQMRFKRYSLKKKFYLEKK